MNKKTARKISRRRRKVQNQNERAYWRGVERQKIINDFKVSAVSDDDRDYIVSNCEEEKCLLCSDPVTREQIEKHQFLAFKGNRAWSGDYLVHSGHLLEPDGETKANAAEIMQTVWSLIAEQEIGDDLRRFDSIGKPDKNFRGGLSNVKENENKESDNKNG